MGHQMTTSHSESPYGIHQWGEERYRTNTRYFNQSLIKQFAKCPEIARRIIAGTWEQPQKDYYDHGTAFHLGILQPELYAEKIVVFAGDRRGTNAWKRFEEDNANRVLLKVSDIEKIAAWEEGFRRNYQAVSLIEASSMREAVLTWRHEYGVDCKGLLDAVVPAGSFEGIDETIIVDLKTEGQDARATYEDGGEGPWLRSAFSCGYHEQAAWYLDGYKAITGEDARFVFIVTSKQPPHETYCYELDEDSIELGRRSINAKLLSLMMAIENDEWLSPGQKSIQKVGFSNYRLRTIRNEYSNTTGY